MQVRLGEERFLGLHKEGVCTHKLQQERAFAASRQRHPRGNLLLLWVRCCCLSSQRPTNNEPETSKACRRSVDSDSTDSEAVPSSPRRARWSTEWWSWGVWSNRARGRPVDPGKAPVAPARATHVEMMMMMMILRCCSFAIETGTPTGRAVPRAKEREAGQRRRRHSSIGKAWAAANVVGSTPT